MGRLLLLLVAASAITATTSAVNRHHTRALQTENLAVSESGSLARQAALSGFALADREVREDFGARSKQTDVALDESGAFGTYDAAVEGVPDGTRVTVVGRYGKASHQVQALFRETIDFPAALVAYAEALDLTLDRDYAIDGAVHRPPSAPERGWSSAGRKAVAGVAVPSASVEQAFRVEAGDDIGRIRGASAFTNRPAPAWLPALLAEAEAHPAARRVGDFDLNGGQIGSPDAPAIVVAAGKAKLKNNARGYGVLVVGEGLEMKDARWEGLVVVRTEAGEEREVKMEGGAAVYGALLLYGAEGTASAGGDGDDAGLVGGHFDLDIFKPEGGRSNNGHGNNCDGVDSSNPGKGRGGPTGKKNRGEDPSDGVDDECRNGQSGGAEMERVYHKHPYDDSYDVTGLDFLRGPDLGADFQDFVAAYGHKSLRVEFFNDFNGSGTYQIGPHRGAVRDGFSRTLRLQDVSTFRLDFESLKELRGSDPGSVQDDDPNRDRALSVRFYDGAALVYEVSAYEHAKDKRDGVATGAGGAGTTAGPAAPGEARPHGAFKVKIKDAAVRWSPQAITRLRGALPALGEAVVVERTLIRDAPAE